MVQQLYVGRVRSQKRPGACLALCLPCSTTVDLVVRRDCGVGVSRLPGLARVLSESGRNRQKSCSANAARGSGRAGGSSKLEVWSACRPSTRGKRTATRDSARPSSLYLWPETLGLTGLPRTRVGAIRDGHGGTAAVAGCAHSRCAHELPCPTWLHGTVPSAHAGNHRTIRHGASLDLFRRVRTRLSCGPCVGRGADFCNPCAEPGEVRADPTDGMGAGCALWCQALCCLDSHCFHVCVWTAPRCAS